MSKSWESGQYKGRFNDAASGKRPEAKAEQPKAKADPPPKPIAPHPSWAPPPGRAGAAWTDTRTPPEPKAKSDGKDPSLTKTFNSKAR